MFFYKCVFVVVLLLHFQLIELATFQQYFVKSIENKIPKEICTSNKNACVKNVYISFLILTSYNILFEFQFTSLFTCRNESLNIFQSITFTVLRWQFDWLIDCLHSLMLLKINLEKVKKKWMRLKYKVTWKQIFINILPFIFNLQRIL